SSCTAGDPFQAASTEFSLPEWSLVYQSGSRQRRLRCCSPLCRFFISNPFRLTWPIGFSHIPWFSFRGGGQQPAANNSAGAQTAASPSAAGRLVSLCLSRCGSCHHAKNRGAERIGVAIETYFTPTNRIDLVSTHAPLATLAIPAAHACVHV